VPAIAGVEISSNVEATIFLIALLLLRFEWQQVAAGRGRRRSRVLVSTMSAVKATTTQDQRRWGSYYGLMGLFPGDATIHHE
jgi:hypothetical protein